MPGTTLKQPPPSGSDKAGGVGAYPYRRMNTSSLLNIRSFKAADGPVVKEMFLRHARSQVVPAVKFYLFRNFHELMVLFVLGFFYLRLRQLFTIAAIFILYLYLKAKLEYEKLLRSACGDLEAIEESYLSSEDSHFWVAEIRRSEKAGDYEIVGAAGVQPSSESTESLRIGLIQRLIVRETKRRMRVGTSLLSTLHAFFRQRNFQEVRLWANNLRPEALRFYHTNGYETLSTTQRNLMRGDLLLLRRDLTESLDEGGAMGTAFATSPNMTKTDHAENASLESHRLQTSPSAQSTGDSVTKTQQSRLDTDIRKCI